MAAMLATSALPTFAQGKAACGIGAAESEMATTTLAKGGLGELTSQTAHDEKEFGTNEGQGVVMPHATSCKQG
jgi:hypothetical protein